MATYGKQNKVQKIKKYIWIGATVLAALIVAIFVFNLFKAKIAPKPTVAQGNVAVSSTISKDTVSIVRTNTALTAGDMADITKFEIVTVPSNLVPVNAVDDISLIKDKRVKNNLSKGEFVLISDLTDATAWYEDGDRLIEHIFPDSAIPANVVPGNIIDIKLFRKNAEDPVVVSKATVVNRNANILTFYLNQKEQEDLKEAATEGSLYATLYLDTKQSASEVNYFIINTKETPKNVEPQPFAEAPKLN